LIFVTLLVVALHQETVLSYAENTKYGALIGTALLGAWPKALFLMRMDQSHEQLL